MGAVVLGVLALYLLVSIGVVVGAISYARKHNKNTKAWGSGAALVMYLLVFWDHIPTVVAHKYYCETEAGFWVYKTVDQWKKENPGVMETLVKKEDSHFVSKNSTSTYILNRRFKWVLEDVPVTSLTPLFLHTQEVIDINNDEIMVRYVDFSTGYLNAFVTGNAGWSGMKFWMLNQHCNGGGANQDKLRNIRNNLTGMAK